MRRLARVVGKAGTGLGARRTKGHLAFLAFLLVAGVVLIAASHQSWVISVAPDVGHGLLEAVGEAFIVAALLAIAVDPFVQRRFAEEWGQGVFWAIFNPDAPPALRSAVNRLAGIERYVIHGEWTLTLNWTDESQTLLTLRSEASRRFMCVSRDGWQPVTYRSNIVTRFDGSPSRFTGFTANLRQKRVALDEDEIEAHVTTDDLTKQKNFDAHRALEGVRAEYREEISTRLAMETVVRAVDSFPLFVYVPFLAWTITIKGDAVADLFFELFGGARSGSTELPVRTDEDRKLVFSSIGVLLPYSGMVVQWHPRDREKGIDEEPGVVEV
jgi:hypothetical protein